MKIKDKWIDFGTGTNQVSARDLPADFTPSNYTPAQVASEGTDKTSAHLKGIDNKIATLGGGGGGNEAVTSYSTTQTLAITTDQFVKLSASGGAFTVTLPTASGNTGYIFILQKTDSTFNQITIDGNGSETINGNLTRKLSTQYETLKIISDGTNWLIKDRYIDGSWHSSGITLTYTNVGTVSGVSVTWQRSGQSLKVKGKFTAGTTVASTFSMNLPSGLTIDSSVNFLNAIVGVGSQFISGNTGGLFSDNGASYLILDGSDSDSIFAVNTYGYQKKNGNSLIASGNGYIYNFDIPIAEWEA